MVGKEFLCLPVFFRNVAALYLYLGSDKYEVNFLTRVSRNASEVMEGIAGTFLLESSLMCILQHEAVAGDGLVGFRLVGYVEVSGNYGRLVAYNLFYFLNNQQSTFFTGFCSHMVKVRIDGHKDFSVGLVFQLGPGGNTGAGTVPSDESYTVGVL